MLLMIKVTIYKEHRHHKPLDKEDTEIKALDHRLVGTRRLMILMPDYLITNQLED